VELKCGVKTLSDVHTTGLALLTGEKCVNILPYNGREWGWGAKCPRSWSKMHSTAHISTFWWWTSLVDGASCCHKSGWGKTWGFSPDHSL